MGNSEAYLISIGNKYNHIYRTIGKILGKENESDILGRIIIDSNCFIGARSILLYGISLPNNTIVVAGSVARKSFENSNIIIGGNLEKLDIGNRLRIRLIIKF